MFSIQNKYTNEHVLFGIIKKIHNNFPWGIYSKENDIDISANSTLTQRQPTTAKDKK